VDLLASGRHSRFCHRTPLTPAHRISSLPAFRTVVIRFGRAWRFRFLARQDACLTLFSEPLPLHAGAIGAVDLADDGADGADTEPGLFGDLAQ
jgi:hypothetical protein